MKKILILSTNSFIGKNIKQYLENKFTIFCLNRKDVDFKNQELLQLYITEIDPDIVINCSGVVGSSTKNQKLHDFDILNENIILNSNILNSCRNLNIKKIILFSSYRLFGDDIHENYDENDIQKSDIKYNVGYLTSKKILDLQIKLFMTEYKIDIVCLLMTNIFGCYDDFSINGRIVPSMISNIKKHTTDNSDLIINSNKQIHVNLIFVDDISKIVELCILKENIHGNIIVFNKNGIITLERLTNMISDLFNYKKNITFNNDTKINDTNIMKPNITKFNQFFENFEFTELEKAIKITCDSIKL
jgi:GDP-L-fucose synthase